MRKADTPTQRYKTDVSGMPAYAAVSPFAILIGPESMVNAIPKDDENCAIAQGCRAQLKTPYVSVGRRRTDLALPHPRGVVKPGHGPTRWAIYRFENPESALRVIVAADTGKLDGMGVVIELRPPRPSDRPTRKRSGAANGAGRKLKGRGQDRLTLMGVRNLNGRRR